MDPERHVEDSHTGPEGQVMVSTGRAVEVEGTLSIRSMDLAVSIRADGREVVCDVPSLYVGWALLRLARQAHLFSLPLREILSTADVRLSVRLWGRIVAEAGPGIAPGRLAAWLGLSGLRLRVFGKPILAALEST